MTAALTAAPLARLDRPGVLSVLSRQPAGTRTGGDTMRTSTRQPHRAPSNPLGELQKIMGDLPSDLDTTFLDSDADRGSSSW